MEGECDRVIMECECDRVIMEGEFSNVEVLEATQQGPFIYFRVIIVQLEWRKLGRYGSSEKNGFLSCCIMQKNKETGRKRGDLFVFVQEEIGRLVMETAMFMKQIIWM